MKRRIISLLLAVALFCALLPDLAPAVHAAVTSSYAPYVKIEYDYSSDVVSGTIRYMSQISTNNYFSWDYWPESNSLTNYKTPGKECGTASISMALSYVGVNKTPYDILVPYDGSTMFIDWGDASVSTYLYYDLSTAMENYLNGNGKYSPPVIHLDNYSNDGHYVVLIGQISSNVYQVLDPANTTLWQITINGSTATYTHPSTGSAINDTIDLKYSDGSNRTDDIRQWYNPNSIICSHDSYDSCGVCTSCGREYDWESSYDATYIGTYEVTKSFNPRTDKPYDAATKANYTIAAGKTVEVLGRYENAFGSKWYKFSYNGNIGYVYETYLEFLSYSALQVQCSGFSPADGAVLEKKAQPVIGTVSSNYPLAAIYAYLDGERYATWQAGNNSTTQVSLRETDINYDLSFSTLADGKHTIELIAHSFIHDEGVYFHVSDFYIGTGETADTTPGKPTLYTSMDGNSVTFTWSATSNTTHYNVWLEYKGEDGSWQNYEQVFYAESGFARTLPAGEWRAQLLSYNSNAYESDGSDWKHTWADDVFFTISNTNYTVSYNANGGTGSYQSPTVSFGGSFTIPTAPTRTGYTFSGWTAYRHGDGTWYCAGYGWYTESAIAANQYTKKLYTPGVTYTLDNSWFNGCPDNTAYTFYAQWVPNSYSITYNANGGSGAPAAVTAVHGDTVTLSTTEPVREGWDFVAWCTDPDRNLGTIYLPGESLTVTEHMTLYAIWEKVLSVPQITKLENTASGIKITWNAVSGAENYRVYAKTSKGWLALGTTSGTSFTYTGAKSGYTYTFTVRCLNAEGTAFTSSFNATGWKQTYVAQPAISKLENTANGIKITWNAVAGAGKYRVYAKTSKGWLALGTTTGTSFTYTGAKSGYTYTLTVRALNAAGNAFVSSFNATGWKQTYVAQPAISKLENTANGIKITWNAVAGAGKYRVYAKTSKGWLALGTTTGTSFTYTGAKSGYTYTFTVRALNAAGTAFVSSYNTTGWRQKYIAQPTVTKLTNTTQGINITWGAVSGAERYRVFVKTASGWKTIGTTTGTGFTWTGAQKGVTYTFTVRCVNAANNAFTSSYNTSGWSIKRA